MKQFTLPVAGLAMALLASSTAYGQELQPVAEQATVQMGPPAPETAGRSAVSPDQEIDVDPILAEALILASAKHPSVHAAEANARAAGVDVSAARWTRFPSVTVQGLVVSQKSNRVQPEVVVDQPIWTGGRITATVRRARAKEGAADAAYKEAVETIALSVVRDYYELFRWRGRVDILTESAQRHEAMVATMDRRVKQEISPLSDLELARMRLLQVQQQLFQAKSQAAVTLQQFRDLVGDSAYTPDNVVYEPPSWPVFDQNAVMNEALAVSPRLRRLRFEEDASGQEARIARASMLPKLSGQYSFNDTTGHRFGLVLRAQTEGGLSALASSHAAQLREQSAEYQTAAAQRDLRDAVVSDVLDYQSNSQRADNAKAVAASSQRVTDSYVRQFTSGRRTWLDVMNAMREASSAQIDALDTRVAALQALSRIVLRTGRWQLVPQDGQS
jgi:adhesin transport system outer membrane protein